MLQTGPWLCLLRSWSVPEIFILNCSFDRGKSYLVLFYRGCYASCSEELVHKILGSLSSVTVSRYLTPVGVTQKAVSPPLSLQVILRTLSAFESEGFACAVSEEN